MGRQTNIDGSQGTPLPTTPIGKYAAWYAAKHQRALLESNGVLYATMPAWLTPGAGAGSATKAWAAAGPKLKGALLYVGGVVSAGVAGVWAHVKESWIESRKNKIIKTIRAKLEGNPDAQAVLDLIQVVRGKNAELQNDLLNQVESEADEVGRKIKAEILAKWDAQIPAAVAAATRQGVVGRFIFDQDYADQLRNDLVSKLNSLIDEGKRRARDRAQAELVKLQSWERGKEAQMNAALAEARDKEAQRAISRRYASQSDSALLRTLAGLNAERNGGDWDGPKSAVRGSKADRQQARLEIIQLLDKRGVSH